MTAVDAAPGFTTRPELVGDIGMISSTHWIATACGMAALERGGNAFDAAVAAGFVLQVVEPHLNGPGGDSSIIGMKAGQSLPFVVCGQGVMPEAATASHIRDDLGLEAVPGNGLLPATVPLQFDGYMLMLAEYGTKTLGETMSYAIHYAERGFPVVPSITSAVDSVLPMFREHWPTSLETWSRQDRAPATGASWRLPRLARTYRRLVAEAEQFSDDRCEQIEHARTAWRTGWIAEAIINFVSTTPCVDATGRQHAGLLQAADLAEGAASVESPVSIRYGNTTVYKTGPWAQGPVFLAQLAMLDRAAIRSMDPGSAEFVHTVVEVAKLAYADREAYFGDLEPGRIPLDTILSSAYATERVQVIEDRASLELRPGRPDGMMPRLPAVPIGGFTMDRRGLGEPTRGDTCHVCVADSDGNIVAVTPSGGWLQSSPTIPELGFCLGTRGQMTWLEEGLASTLTAGRRPRSTLSPTLALRDDGRRLAFGTPGGDQQDQWSLLMFLNLEFGMNLQEAIDAPAFHSNHFPQSFAPRPQAPGEIEIEARFSADVVAELKRRGHIVRVTGDWELGRLCAVAHEPGGRVRAAANPRFMRGYAAGR